jgi:hypothetical protein
MKCRMRQLPLINWPLNAANVTRIVLARNNRHLAAQHKPSQFLSFACQCFQTVPNTLVLAENINADFTSLAVTSTNEGLPAVAVNTDVGSHRRAITVCW